MAIKIMRQNIASALPQPPPHLDYGIIASDKSGKLYVGDSSNKPVGVLDEKNYSQVSNPNLLDNSDFINPVNQKNQIEFDRNGYCIDRWQIFESTYNADTRVVKADAAVTEYGSQFRQIVSEDLFSIGDIVTFSAYVNNTNYNVTKTIEIFDSHFIKDAPYDLETSWGGFKLVRLVNRPELFVIMFLKPSQSITVNWAKLERGNSVTPYVPKGYGQELSECLRYYQHFNVNFRGEAFNVGDGEKYFTTISFYPMRKVPSVTIDAAHYWGGFSGLTAAVEQTDGVYNDRTLRLAVNATAQNPDGAFTAVITLSANY